VAGYQPIAEASAGDDLERHARGARYSFVATTQPESIGHVKFTRKRTITPQEILPTSDSGRCQSRRRLKIAQEQTKGIVAVAQNANVPTPVPQNPSASTSAPPNANAPKPVPQNANPLTPAAVQNAGAPKPVPQNPNPPMPRSDRPAEMCEVSPRQPPARPQYDGPRDPAPATVASRDETTPRLVMRRVGSWLTQLVSSTFIQFLLIFFVGVVTTLAWQAYSDAGREAVAGWCLSIAPQAPPITQNLSSPPDARNVSSPPVSQDVSSPPVAQNVFSSSEERIPPIPPDQLRATSDQLKSTSQALAAIRESIDKLAAELAKLQTADRGTPERASVASGLPPASKPPSRAAPSR
jgi:hypothetical protein